MTGGERLYTALCGTAASAGLFDKHVTACILALAWQESRAENLSVSELTGLDGRELRQLFLMLFPDAIHELDGLDLHPVEPSEEERSLRDILWMYCADASPFELLLARMIARRCQRPNHLWQDLGLGNRGELGKLMRRHFPRLADRNSADMKWKKFFYRMMCSSTGFSLCTVPVCGECDDFSDCFGDEDGQSMLAWLKNRPLDRQQKAGA